MCGLGAVSILDLGIKAFPLFLFYVEMVCSKDWQFVLAYNAGQDFMFPKCHNTMLTIKPCRNSNVKYSLLQTQEIVLDFIIYTYEDLYQKTTARKRQKMLIYQSTRIMLAYEMCLVTMGTKQFHEDFT